MRFSRPLIKTMDKFSVQFPLIRGFLFCPSVYRSFSNQIGHNVKFSAAISDRGPIIFVMIHLINEHLLY